MAKEALAAGHRVVGTVRNEAARAEFEPLRPGRSFGRMLDVTNEKAVSEVVAGIGAAIGAIDVLVNNAGCGQKEITEWSRSLPQRISTDATRAALHERNCARLVVSFSWRSMVSLTITSCPPTRVSDPLCGDR